MLVPEFSTLLSQIITASCQRHLLFALGISHDKMIGHAQLMLSATSFQFRFNKIFSVSRSTLARVPSSLQKTKENQNRLLSQSTTQTWTSFREESVCGGSGEERTSKITKFIRDTGKYLLSSLFKYLMHHQAANIVWWSHLYAENIFVLCFVSIEQMLWRFIGQICIYMSIIIAACTIALQIIMQRPRVSSVFTIQNHELSPLSPRFSTTSPALISAMKTSISLRQAHGRVSPRLQCLITLLNDMRAMRGGGKIIAMNASTLSSSKHNKVIISQAWTYWGNCEVH